MIPQTDSFKASAADFILNLNMMSADLSADAADLSCFLLPLIQRDSYQ